MGKRSCPSSHPFPAPLGRRMLAIADCQNSSRGASLLAHSELRSCAAFAPCHKGAGVSERSALGAVFVPVSLSPSLAGAGVMIGEGGGEPLKTDLSFLTCMIKKIITLTTEGQHLKNDYL